MRNRVKLQAMVTDPKAQNSKVVSTKMLENKRVAKTRRQRGYNWEDTLVKRFNALEDWNAFRLGSPSTGLPDVLAVGTKSKSIITIEAKSGTGTSIYVPSDQIERCQRWIRAFQLYKHRKIVLAFKFLSKKRIGKSKYERRQLREFYKIWDESREPTDFVCTYDGKTYLMKNGKRDRLSIRNLKMPFK